MAGESIVGALRAILGLDTASYEDGAKRAANVTTSLGKTMVGFAGGIALERHISNAVNALKHFVTGAVDTADNLLKLSQKTGISVERLSGLKHAAELSDVSIDGLARGFKNLAIELVKAQTGGVTPAANAFQLLGININKIKPGDTQEAFLQISEALSKFEDGGNKAALAAAFFGKKFGPDLLPLLDQGRAGIEKTIEAARKLGLIVSTETAIKAEIFNDRMKDLGSAIKGVALQALAPLADGMAKIATSFVNFINKTDAVAVAANGIARAFAFVADNLGPLNQLLGFFVARLAITTVLNFAGALVTFARATAAAVTAMSLANITSLITIARFATLATIVALASGNLPTLTDAIEKVGGAVAKMMPKDTSKIINDGLERLGINTRSLQGELAGLGNTVDDFNSRFHFGSIKNAAPAISDAAAKAKQFKETIFGLTLQAREASGAFIGLAPGFVEAARGLKLFDENGKGLQATLNLTTKEAIALNNALFRVNAAKLTEEFQTPWLTYEQTMARLNAQMEKFNVTQEVFAAASLRAATVVRDAYGNAANAIVSPMANAFKTLSEMNKNYAGTAKALAIGEALVNTYLAANKAYAAASILGPIAGAAAAAAAIAAGLINVAKIRATEFATGGSFKVGGVGGIDSQLVQFKATPGEMVDVRKPGQDRSTSTEVTVRGMKPGDLFTGDMVRSMFDALNAGTRDGYRLTVAAA